MCRSLHYTYDIVGTADCECDFNHASGEVYSIQFSLEQYTNDSQNCDVFCFCFCFCFCFLNNSIFMGEILFKALKLVSLLYGAVTYSWERRASPFMEKYLRDL